MSTIPGAIQEVLTCYTRLDHPTGYCDSEQRRINRAVPMLTLSLWISGVVEQPII